ncbi:MAG TPA: hypothetical protein DCL74_04955 [Succinivibrionaceae bacterium]|nr:hypothetical protein [Succinivibrionaceae bacterium]
MNISKRMGKLLTLIAALILSVVLVVSLKTYLTDSQIQISFNVSPAVTGKYRATFYFTDEPGRNIDPNNKEYIVSQDKDLTAGRFTQIEFKKLIRPHKKLQKFQLTLSYIGDPNAVNNTSVDIRHIQLSRSTVKQLEDSYRITFNGAAANFIQANDLNLKPRYTHFAVFGILIITFIGTGVFYKLLRFVLNQRSMQQSHYADIAFILAIVVTLAIPTIGINTTPNIPEPNENRMLAEYKPFFTNDWHRPINLTYMKDFENWFNDRFGARNDLVSLKKQIDLHFNEIIYSKTALCQKFNSWCFLNRKTFDEIGNVIEKYSFPKINIPYIRKIVEKTNIPIIILNYPMKTEIYPEKIQIVTHKVKKAKVMFSDYAQKVFEKELGNRVKIINLKEFFLKHKKDNDLIYFVDEHHATEYGNKLVVDYLAKILNFKPIEYESQNLNIATGEFFRSTKDYWARRKYGETFGETFGGHYTGIENKYFRQNYYKTYSLSNEYQNNIEIKYEKNCDAFINLHNKNIKKALKVYVLGNSFVETFSKMLITSVSDVYRRRVNTKCGPNALNSEKVISEIKNIMPDLIIIPFYADTFNKMQ